MFSIRKISFVFVISIAFLQQVFSQSLVTLNGSVIDEQTGETLIGASVFLKGAVQKGTLTNNYGYFSLAIAPGNYQLNVSYVGYETFTAELRLMADQKISIKLKPSNQLKEVVVNAGPADNNVRNPLMGVQKLNVREVKNIPVLFGEKDILKTLQLLPGIKSAGEGNSGFFVRGGATDHNLILLDEAPVYNASHLLGFFSTFNSDAIKDVTVYKGGMPAQYGGRLASVLDIHMNDGNKRDYTIEGGIGLISSKLKVEGPFKKDRSSFMVSGRRTYADMFLAFSPDSSVRGNKLYFYDLNVKTNFILNDKNTLFVSGYFGRDNLELKEAFGFSWGNKMATIRLNHLFSNHLFSNTSFIYSDYNYLIENFLDGSEFRVKSTIRDFNLKQDFQLSLNQHALRFGINAIHHSIKPGEISSDENSSINEAAIENRYGVEGALYLGDDWKLNDRIALAYGLRLNAFALLGPGNFITYNSFGENISQQHFSHGKIVKSYFNLEPRFSSSFQIADNKSLKASYTRNTQNLHLMSNSTTTSPTDVYIMSSNNTRPEIADQVALGYFNNFKKNTYEFSAEVYYKWMRHQIEYRTGTDLRGNQNVEADLLYGDGRAYGLELLIKKNAGRFNGWIGYTLAKTERQFEGIDNGHWFNAKQDRTHDLSLVGIYKWKPRWTFSSTFVYNTGNAISYPSGKYELDGQTLFYYTERNGYRTPAYHRLDLAATLEAKPGKKYQSSWSFGIYNLYNRKNTFSIDFEDDPNHSNQTRAIKTSLFGIIPSVTWNFKF